MAASVRVINQQQPEESGSTANPTPDELLRQRNVAQAELAVAQIRIAELERELTRRKYVEDVLHTNTAKLRLVLKQVPVMIWTVDKQLRITSWASSTALSNKLQPANAVGQRLPDFFGVSGDEFPPVGASLRANAGEFSTQPFNWQGYTYVGGVEPLWSREGAVVGSVGIAVETTAAPPPGPKAPAVTEVPERQYSSLEQEIESRKIEAVRRLAGGIAHEFNNILTGIVGYADLLKLWTRPTDPGMEAILTIQEGATRATRLTQQLLGYARRGKNQNHAFDAAAVLLEAISEWKHRVGERYHAGVKLASDMRLTGDPQQWRDVYRSLLQNAQEAMPDGGTIEISGDFIEVAEPIVTLDGDLPPGRYARIVIRDHGEGIAPENLKRIFDPFFTTKRGEQNLGMGLSLAYGIVRNHGGALLVESEPSVGTSVRIVFPAPLPEAGPLSAEARVPQVMVVDDEAYVRQALEQMLKSLNYRAQMFEDCHTAVAYYREHQADVDLVIMDLVMPRSSGKACFAAFKAINPGVKAILASGFGQDGAVQEALNLGMAGFLQKPFQLQTLGETLSRLLNRPNSTL